MKTRMQLISLFALMVVTFVGGVSAAENYMLEFGSDYQPKELEMAIGKSQIITSRSALDQVVIGSPEVADIKLLSSTQVLILGMRPGHTNLVFRTKRNRVTVMDVVVGYDIGQIKRKLYEMLPDEQEIEIRASNNKVILGGQVSSLIAMEEILSVARSYVPAKSIVNLTQVGGGHQVMLEVRIAEVSRNSLRELGVKSTFSDYESTLTSGATGSPLNQTFPGAAPFPSSFPYAPVAGAVGPTSAYVPVDETLMVAGLSSGAGDFLNITHGSVNWAGIDSLKMSLTALEKRGLADVLAEPNLTALSGQEASFLAGGEIAIPVSQSNNGSISVDYKEFGIGLKFTPIVLDKDRINIKLNTEVSSIDHANSVQAAGFQIPGISTRRTGTTVEIGDGQSFAIAGLLEKNMRNVINEVPGLGQIPILGALFRSTDFQRNETELVIIVTPRIVAPTTMDKLQLPTDVVLPPNELDQYLFGFLEHFPRARREGSGSETESPEEKPVLVKEEMVIEEFISEEKQKAAAESAKDGSINDAETLDTGASLEGRFGHQI